MPINPTRIRALRLARGLTQRQAADAAGLTQGRWWQLEAGQRPRPSADVLDRVAAALRVPMEELIAPPVAPPSTRKSLRKPL